MSDLRAAIDICVDIGLGQETYRAKANLADFEWVADGPHVGLDTMRRGLSIEQKRELHGQHPAFSRAVVSPQQQPTAMEMKFLIVVAIQIHQSRS